MSTEQRIFWGQLYLANIFLRGSLRLQSAKIPFGTGVAVKLATACKAMERQMHMAAFSLNIIVQQVGKQNLKNDTIYIV